MKKGEGYILPCVLIVILSLLCSATLTFLSSVKIVEEIKDEVRLCLDSYVSEKSIEIFSNVKQGRNDGAIIAGDDLGERLKENRTFSFKNNMFYNLDKDGNELFYLTSPVLEYTLDESDELYVSTEYTIYIPVSFCGIKLYTFGTDIKTVSRFSQRF